MSTKQAKWWLIFIFVILSFNCANDFFEQVKLLEYTWTWWFTLSLSFVLSVVFAVLSTNVIDKGVYDDDKHLP